MDVYNELSFLEDTDFVTFLPKKDRLRIEINMPCDYKARHSLLTSYLGHCIHRTGTYVIELNEAQIAGKSGVIKELLDRMYKNSLLQE